MGQEKPDIYTAEFGTSAVKLANESDMPISQMTKDLGININIPHNPDQQIQPAQTQQ